MYPVNNYKVTCPYGKKGNWKCGYHCGVDLVPADYKDFNIYAPVNASVWQIGRNHKYYGNYIVLNHNDGYFSRYAHLKEIKINAGKQVREGEVLGVMGDTGNAFGVHLHWEVNKGSRMAYPANTNPLEYLKMKEAGELDSFKYYVKHFVKTVQVEPKNLKLEVWDAGKRTTKIRNYMNASYFWYAGGVTVPIGHFVGSVKHADTRCLNALKKRGLLKGDKIYIDALDGNESYKLSGNYVSSLVVEGNKAGIYKIRSINEMPNADFIVSGIPIMAQGEDVSWSREVTKEGWSEQSCRPTYHSIVALKPNDNHVYLMSIRTRKSNCVQSSELYKKLKSLGFSDAIKLDGGGSQVMDVNGKNVSATEGNRRIFSVLTYK